MQEETIIESMIIQMEELTKDVVRQKQLVSEWKHKYEKLQRDYLHLEKNLEDTLSSDTVFVDEIDRLRNEVRELREWKRKLLEITHEEDNVQV